MPSTAPLAASSAPLQRPHAASSVLARWHLFSLDAPTVATLWTCFVARALHVRYSAALMLATFLAVWVIYATDRLLDTRHLPTATEEERHRFHRRHRRAFLIAIAAASLALLAVLPRIDPTLILREAAVAAALGLWFLIVHRSRLQLPKEVVVGIFFAVAVFLPSRGNIQSAWPALFFANLCSLNCLFIYAWEQPAHPLRTHPTTRFGLRHLGSIATLSALLPTAAIVLHHGSRPILIAIASSVCALCGLHTMRHRMARTNLRAAADLALLAPLLVLPFLL